MKGYLLDNVWVLEVLQEGDLPDSSTRHTIILLLEPYLLDGHDLIGLRVLGLVYDTIRALSQLLQPLILVKASDRLRQRLLLLYRLCSCLHS